MRAESLYRAAAVFAGLLWAATLMCAGQGQAQTSAKPDAAPPTQTETQGTKKAPGKKSIKSSEWHHFGESDSHSAAGQAQPGAWQPFSLNHGTLVLVPPRTAPKEEFSANRMAGLEKQMWALVNRERLDPMTSAETGGRAQPLRWNEKLASAARAHSRNMIEQRFFSHVDREGRTLATRINAAGIPWRALGENIAINGTVPGAEAAFMNEPRFQSNHRSNILNANYTDVGIGIVQGANGSLYITQDFAAIPPSRGGGSSP